MTAQRVLIVDEPQIQRFRKPGLGAAGYEVLTAVNGAQALKAAATLAPDVILLDLGLPGMDGKDVLAELRTWSKVPVVVLSARDREAEKIAALDLGADDYVNKPFAIGELMARLRTALRHAARAADGISMITTGDLAIDIAAHSVLYGAQPIKLTPKEFDLLAVLVRNAGRVVTHRQILTAVWGPAHTEDLQYLRVFIGQLRQKLKSGTDGLDLTAAFSHNQDPKLTSVASGSVLSLAAWHYLEAFGAKKRLETGGSPSQTLNRSAYASMLKLRLEP